MQVAIRRKKKPFSSIINQFSGQGRRRRGRTRTRKGIAIYSYIADIYNKPADGGHTRLERGKSF